MVVPVPRHDRNLQRSTTPVKQRPPRAEPIHLRAGHPRASGSGWKRFVVGGEKQAQYDSAYGGREMHYQAIGAAARFAETNLRDDEVTDLRKLGWREPELALAGGRDGTALAERLIRTAPSRLHPRGWLVLEAAPLQINKLFALMDQAGFHTIDVEKDLAGSNRVIAGRLDIVMQVIGNG